MRWDLTVPCADCPFRSDRPFFLHPGRAIGIAASLRAGATFACHKTTVADGEGALTEGERTQHCAGALATMAAEGLPPGQMTRIAERLGWYDPARLAAGSPVYDSLGGWVEAMFALHVCAAAGQNHPAPAPAARQDGRTASSGSAGDPPGAQSATEAATAAETRRR